MGASKMENSEVIKEVLTKMINISGRKTNKGHAVYIMDSSLKKLLNKYDFLKHVEIKDTRFLEDVDPVSVMTDLDSVPQIEVGKAIHEIISTMNDSLGKDAGYFFIKELSRNIKDDYQTPIKNMGVDLSLMQLEREVKELEKRMLSTQKN